MSADIIILPVVRVDAPTSRPRAKELTLFVREPRFEKLAAIADAHARMPDDIANYLLNDALDNLSAEDVEALKRSFPFRR